ncbi:MAG: hypothetical protein LBJ74_05010 [Heliobacteriaceae bacterium]|jgi:hypothetical protein|nr:hypothetical protein [Heliobacteriaceae bacterium]
MQIQPVQSSPSFESYIGIFRLENEPQILDQICKKALEYAPMLKKFEKDMFVGVCEQFHKGVIVSTGENKKMPSGIIEQQLEMVDHPLFKAIDDIVKPIKHKLAIDRPVYDEEISCLREVASTIGNVKSENSWEAVVETIRLGDIKFNRQLGSKIYQSNGKATIYYDSYCNPRRDIEHMDELIEIGFAKDRYECNNFADFEDLDY